MHNYYRTIFVRLAVSSTVATVCLISTKAATAQLPDLANDALNMLDSVTEQSSQSQAAPQAGDASQPYQIDPNFKVGIDNFNRNTINLCVSGCLPAGTQQIQQPILNPTHLPIHFERL